MLLTKAEAAAVFEALKSVVGSIRAKQFFCEGCTAVEDNLIGTAHDAPIRPTVEPGEPGAPPSVHSGDQSGEA